MPDISIIEDYYVDISNDCPEATTIDVLVIDGNTELVNDSIRNLRINTKENVIIDEDDPGLRNYTKVCATRNV